MQIGSMRCSKCGFTQMANPNCKSCGKPVPGHEADVSPVMVQSAMAQPMPSTDLGATPPDPSLEATQVMERTDLSSSQSDHASSEVRQLFFHGAGGSLFGIQIVNMFLTLITFGIYYFWGKVKVRRFLMSQSEFEADRFTYLGTGKELLLGFLKAVLVFGVISALFNSAPYLPGDWWVKGGVIAVAYILLLVIIPLALVGARRYRLSRTSWRGIRFSFRGKGSQYIKVFLKGTLLTFLTLGFYTPIFMTQRYSFMTSHSYFGNQQFNFDGRGKDLFGSYVLALFFTLPTLGLCWIWFLAKKNRYFWDHTTFGTTRFHSTVTGGRLLRLYLGNLLLLVFTLGIGWPWVMIRNIRFAFTYLSLNGPLDLVSIQQDAQSATATGEGLGGLLDLDGGLTTA